MLQDAQHIELGLHEQHLISGKFKLCSSQTAAEHLIPELISRLDTDFPELRIDLIVENTENVIDGLLNYEYDLGIIEGRNDDTRLHQERWIDDHLVVFSSPHHPYAKCEMASLSQLEQAKWVLREQGAGTRRIFEGAIHGVIEKLNVWKEYEQVSVLKTLVKNGQYISSLPFLDVEKEVSNGELIILQTPQLNMQRHLSFIWRADSGENPLRDCIITEARRLSRNRQMKK